MRDVTLIDGPFEGQVVEIEGIGGLNVQGSGVPDDHVAYYRPTRDRSRYRFHGFSRVLVRIPWPPSEDAAA